LEWEIIKTEDENIIIERTTIDKEIDVTLMREELDGCLLLLEEQEQIEKRLNEKLEVMEDEEIKEMIQEKIKTVQMNKMHNLLKISELSQTLN